MGETLVDIDGEEFNTEVSFEYGVRDWEGREFRRLCFAYWLGILAWIEALDIERVDAGQGLSSRRIMQGLSVHMSDKNLCIHIDHTEHLLDC